MKMNKKLMLAAVLAAVSLTAAGCKDSGSQMSAAPQIPMIELRDEVVLPDTTGAEIEVLNMEDPIDFSYSSSDTDMLFDRKDGVWLDSMDNEIPINQEKFQAMADNFLKLKAVTEEEAGDPGQYGLDDPLYTVYITDSAKGEAYINIGEQDPSGNYYASLESSGQVYTIKKETVEALVFDYDTLVIRDSLDMTVSSGDIKKAVVVIGGKSVSYDSSDAEAIARIAEGMSAFKPDEFASFHILEQELVSAGLTEEERMTFNVEFVNGGETQSLTVYVGNFVDVMAEKRYVQIEGSDMIATVDSGILGNMLNLTEEQNSIQ